MTLPARLTPLQAERYRTEGYLVFAEPVLPEDRFSALNRNTPNFRFPHFGSLLQITAPKQP